MRHDNVLLAFSYLLYQFFCIWCIQTLYRNYFWNTFLLKFDRKTKWTKKKWFQILFKDFEKLWWSISFLDYLILRPKYYSYLSHENLIPMFYSYTYIYAFKLKETFLCTSRYIRYIKCLRVYIHTLVSYISLYLSATPKFYT